MTIKLMRMEALICTFRSLSGILHIALNVWEILVNYWGEKSRWSKSIVKLKLYFCSYFLFPHITDISAFDRFASNHGECNFIPPQ